MPSVPPANHPPRSIAPSRDDVALVVHDLRNPLAGVSAALQLLGLPLPDDERHAVLTEAAWAAERLGRMITDLLLLQDLAGEASGRVSAGGAPAGARVAMVPLVEEAARVARLGGRLEGVALALHLAPGCEVTGDPVLLRHLVEHLLVTAVQQPPPGTTLQVRLDAQAEDARLTLAVPPGAGAVPLRQAVHRAREGAWPSRAWRGDVEGSMAMAQLLAHRAGAALQGEEAPDGGTLLALSIPRSAA